MLKNIIKKLGDKAAASVRHGYARLTGKIKSLPHRREAPYSLISKNRYFSIHSAAALLILICAFSVVSSCAGQIADSASVRHSTVPGNRMEVEAEQGEQPMSAMQVEPLIAVQDTQPDTHAVASDEPVIIAADRNEPIYEVYKSGTRISVPASLQWFLRDLTEEHDYPEKLFYGMIVLESDFHPRANNSGQWLGLAQITTYWLRAEPLRPYRLTDDHRSRDLFNAEHNILTMIEMWNYARDVYNLDPWDEEGAARLLYWHNTGSDPRVISSHNVLNRKYTRDIFAYAAEMVHVNYDMLHGLIFDLNLDYTNNIAGTDFEPEDFTPVPTSVVVRMEGTLEIPEHAKPSYTGAGTNGTPVFIGWNAEKNGSGAWYEAGDVIENVTEVYRLHAQWHIIPAFDSEVDNIINISYSPGDQGLFEPQVYEAVIGALTPVFVGEISGVSGWEFTGWLPELSPQTINNTEYVAQWKPLVKYEIAYMPGDHGLFTQQTYVVTEEGAAVPAFAGEVSGPDDWKFDGWLPEPSGIVTEDRAYTAQWRQAFTVRYEPGTAGTFDAQKYSVVYGASIPPFEGKVSGQPEHEFTGWLPEVGESVTGDTTYTAQWRPLPRFEVAYLPGERGLFEPQPHSVLAGARTPAFSGKLTSAEDWEFDGWLPEISTIVTEDIEYVAQWKHLPKYEVSYLPGEYGLFSPQQHMLEGGDPTPKFNGKPEGREGFEFGGWYPEVRDFVENDQTYTAQWKQIYTVQYEPGGEGLFGAQQHQILDGDPTPLFAGAITGRPNYEFIGWQPAISQTVVGDVVYVAQWKPLPRYDVIYLPGEHGTFLPQMHTVMTGLPTPEFDGATNGEVGWGFSGWSPAVSSTVTEDVQYTAQWVELPRYEVAYMPGAHGTFEPQRDTVIVGLPTPGFAGRTEGAVGWEFDGWLPEISGTVTENRVYTAQWKALPRYEVTYLPGEHGLFLPQSSTVITGFETPAFTGWTSGAAGWEFDGWHPAISGTVRSDQTYTAQWRELFTIRYDPGEEGVFDPRQYQVADGSPTPQFEDAVPGRMEYRFVGWLPEISGAAVANVTYVAQWERLPEYEVSYLPGAHGLFEPQSHTVMEGLPMPEFVGNAPGAEGWEFDRWHPEVKPSVTSEIEYVAQWKPLPRHEAVYMPGEHGLFEPQSHTVIIGFPTPEFSGEAAGGVGWEFDGWHPEVRASVTEDIEYTAQWRAVPTYEVVYMPGIHGLFEPQPHTVVLGHDAPPFDGDAEGSAGWKLDGWMYSSEPSEGGTVEYTAQWRPLREYKITYLSGVYGTFHPRMLIVTEDSETPIFDRDIPVRNGWRFDGWYPEVTPTVTRDAEYVAMWVQDDSYMGMYSVIYDPGTMGSFEVQEYQAEYGSARPQFAGEPTGFEGYVFDGWLPEISSTVTEDTVYTAQWRQAEPPLSQGHQEPQETQLTQTPQEQQPAIQEPQVQQEVQQEAQQEAQQEVQYEQPQMQEPQSMADLENHASQEPQEQHSEVISSADIPPVHARTESMEVYDPSHVPQTGRESYAALWIGVSLFGTAGLITAIHGIRITRKRRY